MQSDYINDFRSNRIFPTCIKSRSQWLLLKDSPSEELANTIRSVIAGKRVYAPELMDDLYSEENPLTDREKEVLELVADGKNTKEIADELALKSGTVRNYISTILDKLEVKNRIEAISRSKEKGWFK